MINPLNIEKKYLRLCIKEIEDKLSWGKKEGWTNHNFKTLSEDISRITGISISISSIRRIFGQDKSYKDNFNPQLETRNSLVRYLGYESWTDFKKKKGRNFVTNLSTLLVKNKLLLAITGGLALITIILMLIFSDLSIINRSYYFSGHNLDGYAPHTVAFQYDITKLRGDDFSISFDEFFHPPLNINLPKEEHIVTHTYYNSYYYYVYLKRKNKVIATDKVMVRSKGWDYGAFIGDTYFKLPENLLANKDRLVLLPSELVKCDVDTTSDYSTEFKNIDDFGVDGDNMEFSSRLRLNKLLRTRGCYHFTLRFLGTNGFSSVTLNNIGCSSLSRILWGDYKRNGQFDDLSFLAQNLFEWSTFTVRVKDKKGELFFNGQSIHKFTYTKSLGEIKGIHVYFLGSGEIDDIKFIRSNNGQIVINDNFNAAISK